MRRRPTEQEIAQRAQELFEQRQHKGDGEAQRDWDDAKAQLEAAEAAAESDDAPDGIRELRYDH